MRGAPEGAARSTRGRQRRRRIWFTIHSLVGVKLYLLLAVILISGTLAVFTREIDWLLLPEMRVTPHGARASLGEMIAALRAAYPKVGILEGFVESNVDYPRTAARAIGISLEHGVRAYWIDPYDLRVTGHTPILSPGYVLAQLHASLFVPVVGNALVSLFALFILTSVVTGLVVYRRWWNGFVRRPRVRSARVLAGDLHRLLGVWSIAFLIVIGGTSLFFAWDFIGVQLLGWSERPHTHEPDDLGAERLARLGPAPAPLPLDALLGTVQRAHPSMAVTAVVLPQHAAAPLEVFLDGDEILTDRFASRADVDPYTGEILHASLARDASAWRRVNDAIEPLHFGRFLGLLGRTLWFLFGAAASTLALSGVFIHLRRLAAKNVAQDGWLGRFVRPLGGPMGAWKPLAVLVLLVGGYGMVNFAAFVGSIDAREHRLLPAQGTAPARAAIVAVAEPGPFGSDRPLARGARSLVLVQLCDGCAAAARSMHAGVAAGDAPCTDAERVTGERDYLHARLSIPASGADSICLTIEGWDGTVRTLSWPLGAPVGSTAAAVR